MPKITIRNILIILGCGFFIITIGACRTTGGGVHIGWESDSEICHPSCPKKKAKCGPPPHAPAHGYRAKHRYRYYPCVQVYFDISREVYFYMETSTWKMCASLPGDLHVTLGDYVTIEMDSDKPYTKFKDHQKKYPPGQVKRKNDKWVRGS